MNEHSHFAWNEHLSIALWGAAPLVGVLVFLLCTLLLLRMLSRRKSGRMSRAEREMTGLGATTWESYQGPATLGPPTIDPLGDSRDR